MFNTYKADYNSTTELSSWVVIYACLSHIFAQASSKIYNTHCVSHVQSLFTEKYFTFLKKNVKKTLF